MSKPLKTPEKKLQYGREYYQKHREVRSKVSGQYYQRIREAIYTILGKECMRCGFNDKRALQIDHVNGGGARERKNLGMRIEKFILDKIIDGSKDYQILCANCNWIKRSENGENRKLLENSNQKYEQ